MLNPKVNLENDKDTEVQDGRGSDIPVFIRREVDDANLTIEEFRVYCHLARRAGSDNRAWPSYATIGQHCFQSSYPDSDPALWRKKAIEAVAGLLRKRLITKESRQRDNGSATSNLYVLMPVSYFLPEVGSPGGGPGVVLGEDPGSPGGGPQEGTPLIKGTQRLRSTTTSGPSKNRRAGQRPPQTSSSPPTPSVQKKPSSAVKKKSKKRPAKLKPSPSNENNGEGCGKPYETVAVQAPVPDEKQQEEWERIPASPIMTQPVQGALGVTHSWARKYKLLDGVPDSLKRVSFVFYDISGREPEGTSKSWMQAMTMLWRAAKENEAILVAGLEAAVLSRQNGFTLPNPYSYQGYVKNEADKAEVAARHPDRKRQAATHNPEGPLPFGQEWVTLKGGKRVIKIG